MVASRTGDVETPRSLMTEDAVFMRPGGRAVRGETELDEGYKVTRLLQGQTDGGWKILRSI